MTAASSTQILAMHGWAGDQRAWQPWAELAAQRGWSMCCGERGYGQLPPNIPAWEPLARQRLVIAHSLGPHLLPAAVWHQATSVVLLASFAAFVPPGRAGRPVAAALHGMRQCLQGEEPSATESMLEAFFARAAAPFPASLLPSGPLQQGISPVGRERLRTDLQQLASTHGLPEGFPRQRPVLLVEAEDDQIVCPASRALLRDALPAAEVLRLPRAGHCLLGTGLPPMVFSWLDAQVAAAGDR